MDGGVFVVAAIWGVISLPFVPNFFDLIIIPLINTLIFTIFGNKTKARVTWIRYKKAPEGDDGSGVCGRRAELYINYTLKHPRNDKNIIHIHNERFHSLNLKDVKKIKNKSGMTVRYYYGFNNKLRIHSDVGMRIYCPKCEFPIVCWIGFLLITGLILFFPSYGMCSLYTDTWNNTILCTLLCYVMGAAQYFVLVLLCRSCKSIVCEGRDKLLTTNNPNSWWKNKSDYRQIIETIDNPWPICNCGQKLIPIHAKKQMSFNICTCKWHDNVICYKCKQIVNKEDIVYHCYKPIDSNVPFDLHSYDLCSKCRLDNIDRTETL